MIRRYLGRMVALASALLSWTSPAWACPLCESETGERVRAGIFDADFGYNLAVTVLPFSVFLTIVTLIHLGWPWAKGRSGQVTPLYVGADATSIRNGRGQVMDNGLNRRPLMAAGTLLGIGMGGFVDGILFHQMLQLHNMLTAKYPKTGVDAATALVNVEINMFWDGLFHAFTWTMTALGLALLWRAVQRCDVPLSTRTLVGSLSLGWGLFNLIEGLIDHELLGIHHVVEAGNHLLWDMVFLGPGVVLILAGWAVIRTDRGVDVARATG